MAHCCHVFTSQLSLKIGFLDSIITCQHTFLKQILLILAVPIILSHKGQRTILLLIFHRKWKDWQNFWKLENFRTLVCYCYCYWRSALQATRKCGFAKVWPHCNTLWHSSRMVEWYNINSFLYLVKIIFSYFVNSFPDLCLFQINVGRRWFNFLMPGALYRRKQPKEENDDKSKPGKYHHVCRIKSKYQLLVLFRRSSRGVYLVFIFHSFPPWLVGRL